jgi:hypothetical protein
LVNKKRWRGGNPAGEHPRAIQNVLSMFAIRLPPSVGDRCTPQDRDSERPGDVAPIVRSLIVLAAG